MNIHKISISILAALMLFLGFSAPTFAAEDDVQKCEVSIPSSSRPGDLMIVFAKGPEGTTAKDWKDDGGVQGWKQLGFSDLTKGRDVNTAVFYKRKAEKETVPKFSLVSDIDSAYISCGIQSYANDYFYNSPTREKQSTSTDPVQITIKDHPEGQVRNAFEFKNKKKATVFRFAVDTEISQNIQELSIDVVDTNIDSQKVFNFALYRDTDDNGLYTPGTDRLLAESMSDFSARATISFADILLEKDARYIVTADTRALKVNDFLTLTLSDSGDVLDNQNLNVVADVSPVTHRRTSGASYTRYRGTNYGGELIGNDSNYYWPTADTGEWLYAERAYDKNDGTYAVTSNTNETHIFRNFNLPSFGTFDTIDGIEIKMEASALDSSGGTIEVSLSRDGGMNWTDAKVTPTLTKTDGVVYVGSSSDLWGGNWNSGQGNNPNFTNENFRVRINAVLEGGAIQIDGLQVRIYSSFNSPFG